MRYTSAPRQSRIPRAATRIVRALALVYLKMKLPGSILRIFQQPAAHARGEDSAHALGEDGAHAPVEERAHAAIDERAHAPVEERAHAVAPHAALGQLGEALAAAHLERAGYALVAANFALPVGRNLRGAIVNAEIDLVAYEGDVLCFVEVKTRASDWFAAPEQNVDRRKQRQITRAARVYRRTFGLTAAPYRYDVVSIVLPPATVAEPAPNPRIELLRNFWTDAKFRKRQWSDAGADS
ncbi:MAG TPA: YraN family protein [Pyrinomonadaceae bacterium]|nr:YraN family protein [Pyrinomonadaceae bacterium]